MTKLTGKKAVITGGTSGIGMATAASNAVSPSFIRTPTMGVSAVSDAERGASPKRVTR